MGQKSWVTTLQSNSLIYMIIWTGGQTRQLGSVRKLWWIIKYIQYEHFDIVFRGTKFFWDEMHNIDSISFSVFNNLN